MNRLNIIILEDYIICRPCVFWKKMFFLRKHNVSPNSYLGIVIEKFLNENFSISSMHNLFIWYILYYRKEFESYEDFLKNYFLLDEHEINIKSYFLFFKKRNKSSDYRNFWSIQSIMNKMSNYFGGEFFNHEN